MEQSLRNDRISVNLPFWHLGNEYLSEAFLGGLLSPREKEIALLVTQGISNKQIAKKLALSQKTVKNVLTKVFDKTKTQSRSELAVLLVRLSYSKSWPTGGLEPPCLCATCPTVRKGLCPKLDFIQR